MQTQTTAHFLNTPPGQEANAIIRSCVHCGFCNATCPTYQLLGDERDGPRGRIYLIKQMLEGQKVSAKTQTHLDRCLSCRSCETTCPSGVQYGRLIDIGRELVDKQVKRSVVNQFQRFALRKILPYPARFSILLKISQWLKPLFPHSVKIKIPDRQKNDFRLNKTKPTLDSARKMVVLQGCAQSVITPNTNRATTNLFHKLGIELIEASEAGCCGAVCHHLSASQDALSFMRHNIDVWWPLIEQGIEAIVITASGCGVMVKEYGPLLKHDSAYAEKAKKVSELAKDVSEILVNEKLPVDPATASNKTLAFQSPCTLQHGQQLEGLVESLLIRYGFNLVPVADAHLCCGSAGTYSILQKELAQQLLNNKLTALKENKPDLIVTANIGCQLHLQTQAEIPVKHWVEILDEHCV